MSVKLDAEKGVYKSGCRKSVQSKWKRVFMVAGYTGFLFAPFCAYKEKGKIFKGTQ